MSGFAIQRTVLAVLAGLAACGCQRHAPSGGADQPPHWSYEGATGPAHWGSLAPEYALCASGKRQSPIEIQDATARDLANISFHYQPVPLEIVNNGHTIQVNYARGSFIEVDGARFDLQQFHFHSPSEHRVRRRRAQCEMHLVHKSDTGELAVVGVLIDEGAHNPSFDPVWRHLPDAPGPARRVAATIDAGHLLPADPRTYRYEGSLTTPPGTEGVKWLVMTQPLSMSADQLAAFRRIISANNRPTQPLHGRTVFEDSSK